MDVMFLIVVGGLFVIIFSFIDACEQLGGKK